MKTIEKKLNFKQMTSAIEYFLSSPDTKVGRRLLPEPELAELFNTGRWYIRQCLDELVKKGLVERRKGSGTYVRKIPRIDEINLQIESLSRIKSLGKKIFADSVDSATPEKEKTISGNSSSGLNIGLWSDWHCANINNQAMLGKLVKYSTEAGNKLFVNSIVERLYVKYPTAYLRELLRAQECDGYIVVGRWIEGFLEALGSSDKPILAVHTGNPSAKIISSCPASWIYIDANALIPRAIDIFAGQGFKKIAMLGLEPEKGDESIDYDRENQMYDFAMFCLKSNYRKIFRTGIKISESFRVAKAILESNDRPEAIYVADNYVLLGLIEAMEILNLCPGKDIAVITLSNRDDILPENYNWSRMEFDTVYFSQLIVNSIGHLIHNNQGFGTSIALQASWKPGSTHFLA